jgi:hypothetical protein
MNAACLLIGDAQHDHDHDSRFQISISCLLTMLADQFLIDDEKHLLQLSPFCTWQIGSDYIPQRFIINLHHGEKEAS